MIFIQLFVIAILTIVTTSYTQNCPDGCVCQLDIKGNIENICTNSGWNSIPIDKFNDDVEILIIRGPNNYLTIGPIFNDFKKLEILRITDSNIPSVGTYSFWGVPTLRILDLSWNNISALHTNNFRGQENLNELNLSHNKINGMPSWVFRHLTNLRRLNLSDNLIDILMPRLFFMLNKLKYLDLSGNPLIELPVDVFKDVPDLKQLKCRRCNLCEINPNVTIALPRLTELDLGDNNLKYIDERVFENLRRLIILRLDRNQLTVIRSNLLIAQKSLEYLDLARNLLYMLDNSVFGNLLNLTHLDLSYNKLDTLDSIDVKVFEKLESLNISGNTQMDVKKLRSNFNHMPNLKNLVLADLEKLPLDILTKLPQLETLNISGNSLTNISSFKILMPLNNLKLLDLSRNKINGLHEFYTEKLQKIEDVQMEENPLTCDRCHLGLLIHRAKLLRSWNVFPTCYFPERLRGQPISALELDDLDGCININEIERHHVANISDNLQWVKGNINLFALICGIAFITMAIIIVIGVLSLTRHSAKYYTHEEMLNEKADGMYEKNSDSLSITGNDISFKFSKDDVICTTDDMILPPTSMMTQSQQKPPAPAPSPPLPSSFKTSSNKSFGKHDNQYGQNNSSFE